MYPNSINDGRPARDAFFQSMKSLGTLLLMPAKSVDHAGIIPQAQPCSTILCGGWV
jgi:hypothetical protein